MSADWLFVVAMIALLLAIAALPFVLAGWLLSWAASHACPLTCPRESKDDRLRACSCCRPRTAAAFARG